MTTREAVPAVEESSAVTGMRLGEAVLALDRELGLGGKYGMAQWDAPWEVDNFSIFLGLQRRPKLWGLIGQPRPLIARLRYDDESTRWIMHVYGRENIERMNNLAQKLMERTHVPIHVRLQSETPDEEIFSRGL